MSEGTLEDAYAQYADELVRYATLLVPRSAAADVVADTFADLLREGSTTRWSDVRHPKGFLFGAVANRARMYHRQTSHRRERERRVWLTSRRDAAEMPEPQHELVGSLDALSTQQRAVVYLTYWQDLSVTQVAEALGVGEGSVKRQLARARDRLRGALA